MMRVLYSVYVNPTYEVANKLICIFRATDPCRPGRDRGHARSHARLRPEGDPQPGVARPCRTGRSGSDAGHGILRDRRTDPLVRLRRR